MWAGAAIQMGPVKHGKFHPGRNNAWQIAKLSKFAPKKGVQSGIDLSDLSKPTFDIPIGCSKSNKSIWKDF